MRIRSDGELRERLRVGAASPNLYPLLGPPHLGSPPRSETDVVLTHAYWTTRFGADPDVIGSSLRLDDRSYTIVGPRRAVHVSSHPGRLRSRGMAPARPQPGARGRQRSRPAGPLGGGAPRARRRSRRGPDRIERAGRATPGGAALAASGPFGNRGRAHFFEVAGRPAADASRPPLADYRLVSRNYFDVLGIPVLRGRRPPLRSEGVLPLVVNQAFVDLHLGDGDPLGAGLTLFSELQQGMDRSRATAAAIVGVVGDEKLWRLDGQPRPQMYANIE